MPEDRTPDAAAVEDPPAAAAASRRPLVFAPDPRTVGRDPDYRFTLANERTFLAWIRTALAIAAGGLAAVTVLDGLPGERYLGVALLLASVVTSATSYRRWALAERAMRLEEPLPESRLPLVLAIIVALVAIGTAALVVADGLS